MKKKKVKISFFARLSLLVFVIVMLMYIAACVSPIVADIINSSVSQQFRRIMASLGDVFPFSLFELLVLLSPILLFLVVFCAIRSFQKEKDLSFVINFVAVVLIIFSGHTLALGIGYKTTPISEKMSLPETEITPDNLSTILITLRDEVNSLADSLPRDKDGVFTSSYSFDELSDKIAHSYESVAEQYGLSSPFNSNAKSVYFSRVMSYLRIGGIYTYVTGEANVNTEYPSYDTIFTAAHEMSHQRGVLREDEANFVAYLITSNSADPELRYSAALNLYSYVASALYKTDAERYREVASSLSALARADIRRSNAITQKYGDTIIGDLSERVNDIYLTSNGTDGTVSYSQVVRLAVSYFEMKK